MPEMTQKFPKLHNFNEMYTPPEAMQYITPFLPKHYTYREMCYGKGHMAEQLKKDGFDVVGESGIDCFIEFPECDAIITNPPFNGNKNFFKRAIELKKPFAFLVRLEHLGGVGAYELFKDLNIQIIIPKKRINYITPKMQEGKKVGGSPFHSVWVTYGLELPKDILYA